MQCTNISILHSRKKLRSTWNRIIKFQRSQLSGSIGLTILQNGSKKQNLRAGVVGGDIWSWADIVLSKKMWRPVSTGTIRQMFGRLLDTNR